MYNSDSHGNFWDGTGYLVVFSLSLILSIYVQTYMLIMMIDATKQGFLIIVTQAYCIVRPFAYFMYFK